MMHKELQNYINGKWVKSETDEYENIRNPATGDLIIRNPRSKKAEVEEAVRYAKEAFQDWRDTPVPDRIQPLFKFAQYLKDNQKNIAVQIVNEHGKTLKEAMGEVFRSWQYVEHACGAPDLMKGEITADVGRDISEYFIREPLGVFAFIGPFNFPALTSLYWVWAVACGNTVIVKAPSKTPCTINMIFENGVDKVGFPEGVVNLINCSGNTFSHGLELDAVKGITFIGSTEIGLHVYKLSAEKGKRAQGMVGANNSAVVMPDANFTSESIMGNLLRSCFGNTGQRCFALSNILLMAEIYEPFKKRFVEAAKNLKVGFGLDESTDVGPVVSKDNLEMLCKEIEKGLEEGAKLLLDGRNVKVEGYPNGNWLGPTIFEVEDVKPHMRIWDEEIFGPVVCLIKVESLDEAIRLINSGKYGHSAVIFTEMGEWSQRFIKEIDVGQVGVNIGTPAPIGFYPLGGRKLSKFGALRARGREAIDFYTDQKVVVTRWLGSRESFERTWMENI